MGRTRQTETKNAEEEKEGEEEPQEPPRQPTEGEMERRRQEAQEEKERIQERYQDALFDFWNWHRRYPREEVEVFQDNRLIHPWLWSMENYRDLESSNLSIEDRLRVLRRVETRANRFSWLLTHPRAQGMMTVREYREHFITNDIHIVAANYSEEGAIAASVITSSTFGTKRRVIQTVRAKNLKTLVVIMKR